MKSARGGDATLPSSVLFKVPLLTGAKLMCKCPSTELGWCHQWHRRAQDRTDINFPSVTGDVLVLLDKHGGWGALPLQGAAGGQTQVKH